MKDTLNGDLIILTHVLNTTAVTGFVPAAKALGLRVWLLTDDIVAHQQFFSNPKLDAYPDEILSCDVFNAQSIIELILQNNLHPSAIFTNSDHLQTACAQAADFFALPGKDWRVCYRAKNKTAMRQYLKQSGLETTWYQAVDEINQLATLNPPYPLVAKPQQGVASMDVKLCQNHQDLAQFCNQFWQQHPNQSLLLEQYLQGTAFTLETLGDGENLVALGGFDIELSPPPYFIERSARWNNHTNSAHRQSALAQLQAFGINFGPCHSEFILTAEGPKLIEINYRCIGGGKEFLLDRLLNQDYFKQILRLHLGERINLSSAVDGQAYANYYIAKHAGELQNCPNPFEFNAAIGTKLELLKQRGEKISLTHSDRDRLAIFSAYAKAESQLSESEFVQHIEQHMEQHMPQNAWEIR